MNLHRNAKLTVRQRKEIKKLYASGNYTYEQLSVRYNTSKNTVQKWAKRVSPEDKKSGPTNTKKVVTSEYRKAIIAYRKSHPNHGPIRIAFELKKTFDFANRGTVLIILQEAGLTKPKSKKKRVVKPIPVGRHRAQMDTQQLTAVKGQKGFEYKVSVIHLSTRMKYSEIHPRATTEVCAGVLERARQKLPPFFIVFTDNAMIFTMKFTPHKDRKTAFQKKAESLGIIHALIPKGKPWRNGFIERSNRTDNEAFFHHKTFSSSEERKYLFRLWEMEYNYSRPHQGIGMKTPVQVFRELYPNHAFAV